MSQKRLIEELKQQPNIRKIDSGTTAPVSSMMNTQQPQAVNQYSQENINQGLKIQRDHIQAAAIPVGRNSSQGVYSNMQIRAATIGLPFHPPGGSQERLLQNNLALPQALNLSSQSIERPVSSQSNGRKPQNFLTPQRQLTKQGAESIKAKKLIIKPGQILKTQQTPPQSNVYPSSANTSGLGVQSSKEKLLMDQKTYNDLMAYLIKAECKRIERDKVLHSQASQQSNYVLGPMPAGGQGSAKRSNSTLKRLGPVPHMERHSNNPARIIYQNQATNAGFFYPQNAFNNSFVSSEGRNSKQSKTPSKKNQPQKLKQLNQQSIKRNNYVNELQ